MKRNLLPTAAAIVLMSASGVAFAAGSSPAGSQTMQQQQTQRSSGQAQDQSRTVASMERLLGKTVVGSDGASIGQIADIMLNPDTREPSVAVIDTTEGKQVAIDFTLLTAQGDRVVADDLTPQQLAQMPEFQSEDNMVSLNQNRGQSGQKQ